MSSAGPHLAVLARETGETANLAVAADGQRVVYLRQVASPKLVQTASWAGRTIPGRGTALGFALRGKVGPEGFVARTGSVEPDVTSIAAPVYGPDGLDRRRTQRARAELSRYPGGGSTCAGGRWRVTPASSRGASALRWGWRHDRIRTFVVRAGSRRRRCGCSRTTFTPTSPRIRLSWSCTAGSARPRATGRATTRSCASSSDSATRRRCSFSRASRWRCSKRTRPHLAYCSRTRTWSRTGRTGTSSEGSTRRG